MDIQERKYKTTAQVISAGVEDLAEGNRFDKLIALRDEAQRLVELEHEAELKRMKEDSERLAKDLAAKKERLANLDTLVNGKARATRRDKGQTRSKAQAGEKA